MTRLIDADKLKNAISDVVNYELSEDKKWAKGLEYSLKIIDNAPTVEDRTREVLSLQETIRKLTVSRPAEEFCSECQYHKLAQNFIDAAVDVMIKYDIESVDELINIVRGEESHDDN